MTFRDTYHKELSDEAYVLVESRKNGRLQDLKIAKKDFEKGYSFLVPPENLEKEMRERPGKFYRVFEIIKEDVDPLSFDVLVKLPETRRIGHIHELDLKASVPEIDEAIKNLEDC